MRTSFGASLVVSALTLLLVAPAGSGLLGGSNEATTDLLGSAVEGVNKVGPSDDPAPVPREKVAMLDRLVHEMDKRWRALERACSTNAPFQLVYLEMTREVRNHVAAAYFDDGAEVADFAVAFAQRYFVAIDAYQEDRWSDVTDPWREAFAWGASGHSTALEDALLGMNAHINYDLALVNHNFGYIDPSNKADYNRINDVLDAAVPHVLDGLKQHYEVQLADGPIENLTEPALVDLLSTWRENAWQNGKLLDNALTSVDERVLLETIETEAETVAQAFQVPKPSTEAQRATLCRSHP